RYTTVILLLLLCVCLRVSLAVCVCLAVWVCVYVCVWLFGPKTDQVSVLASLRPVQDILEDIKQGASAAYGAEKLIELQKLLPDKEEVKKLRGFRGDRVGLSEAELFLLHLVDMPSYAERLEAMVVREEFQPRLRSLRFCLRTLTEAAHELLGCGELHTVMRLVLKAGNYMNEVRGWGQVGRCV
uniref:FH2 domain-containing protein n=1 Tax=Callorhinchus milii TaxID=7868 RepID=A0A4W3I9Z1_CALMI